MVGPGDRFVFGYGSLAGAPGRPLNRIHAAHGFVADLRGHARRWGVAMDNRHVLPGYKRYLSREGARPPVHVCFLDVVPCAGQTVNGVCLPVDDVRLAELDGRERNYVRQDVSELVDAGGALVWTYVGSPAGRARFARGLADGDAVIDAGYRELVRAAFAGLGEEEARRCAASLEPGPLPVRELVREDLPAI
jgi:hypothetical protein